jgi:hypothetical protein
MMVLAIGIQDQRRVGRWRISFPSIASVFLNPRFQKTARYRDGARGARRKVQSVVVFSRQIQQAPFRKSIGIFSKVAAAIGLLFQK